MEVLSLSTSRTARIVSGYECASYNPTPLFYSAGDDPACADVVPVPSLPHDPVGTFVGSGNSGKGFDNVADAYAHQVALMACHHPNTCNVESAEVSRTNYSFGPGVGVSAGEHIVYSWNYWIEGSDGSCVTKFLDSFAVDGRRGLQCPAGYDGHGVTSTGDYFCFRKRFCLRCWIGDPIVLGLNDKEQAETDFVGAGPFPLQIVRHYSAQGSNPALGQASDTVAPFGPSWRTQYQRSVSVLATSAMTIVTLRREDGESKTFVLDSGGNPVGRPYEKGTLERLTDGGGALAGWRYRTAEEDIELYDVEGRLVSITNKAGLTQTLAYDSSSGRLDTVTDPFGRVLQFHYNADGRIDTITTPDSLVYAYTYSSLYGALAAVTYPDSEVRAYQYDEADSLPWSLSAIIDENLARTSTTTYLSSGAASSTALAGGVYNYTVTGTTSPTVTEPLGATKSYTFTEHSSSQSYLLDERQQPNLKTGTGHTSETYSYDANGNMKQRTDDEGRITKWTYDLTRNLETQRIEGYGSPVSRTITTQWHPTRRLPTVIYEPLRKTTYTYNDSGDTCADDASASTALVCSRSVQGTTDTDGHLGDQALSDGKPARTWSYHYNADGQLTSVDGPRTDVSDVTTYTYYASDDPGGNYRHGDLASVTNALGHVTQFPAYDAVGRVDRNRRPERPRDASAYWPRGWLKSRELVKAADSIDEPTHDR